MFGGDSGCVEACCSMVIYSGWVYDQSQELVSKDTFFQALYSGFWGADKFNRLMTQALAKATDWRSDGDEGFLGMAGNGTRKDEWQEKTRMR